MSQQFRDSCFYSVVSSYIFVYGDAFQKSNKNISAVSPLLQITKLKIDSNPFAKGFRDSARITQIDRESVDLLIKASRHGYMPTAMLPHPMLGNMSLGSPVAATVPGILYYSTHCTRYIVILRIVENITICHVRYYCMLALLMQLLPF